MSDVLMWVGSIVATVIFTLIGWIFKMLFTAVQNVKDDHTKISKSLSDHKLHAAETFATKKEVNDGFDRVMTKLDKIDDKLDGKVDK